MNDEEESVNIFDQSYHDDGELAEEIASQTLSEQDLITLCEIPCTVEMHLCNRYWSYEKMVIEELKKKGVVRTDTPSYVYEKFSKKYKYHYQKQLEWEKEYNEARPVRLVRNRAKSVLYLEEKNEQLSETTPVSDESLQIQYTPYDTEEAPDTNNANPPLDLDNHDAISNDYESREEQNAFGQFVPHNRNEGDDLSESECMEALIHGVGINVIEMPYSEESMPSLPRTYIEFQEGAQHKSTQETLAQDSNKLASNPLLIN